MNIDEPEPETELTPDMMRLIEAVRGLRAAEVLYEYRFALEERIESFKIKPASMTSIGLPSQTVAETQ